MEIPAYRPFYIESLDALEKEIRRLGLTIPTTSDLSPLFQPCTLTDSLSAPNRFCALPIRSQDALPDGSPGSSVLRRYAALAAGGFGLIWIEATCAGLSSPPRCLRITKDNVKYFERFVDSIRSAAGQAGFPSPVLILQLVSFADTPPGNSTAEHRLDDPTIRSHLDALMEAASLARTAGFDGVDFACCHGSFAEQLLPSHTPTDRIHFISECIEGIRSREPGLLPAVRLNAFQPLVQPHGFGTQTKDFRKQDLTEPLEAVRAWKQCGLGLLNTTVSSPALLASPEERGKILRRDFDPPDEHPLAVLARQLETAKALRSHVPDLPNVGSGFSWLRHFAPHVAAKAISDGAVSFFGMGRGALADPSAPRDLMRDGRMHPEKSCMVCFACSVLEADGEPVGCPIRDPRSAQVYQNTRRFSPEQLRVGAARCHFCEAPPCVSACPTKMNIPEFLRAFLANDFLRAFDILRTSDPLPELTSHLSPGWLQAEGACIETALTGRPVPILDVQFAVAWQARDGGHTGVRLPADETGKSIGIVGAGPAGLAACIRLLEAGHRVTLHEESEIWGGTPERLIPGTRFPGATAEIEAILRPALDAGRLVFQTNSRMGRDFSLADLRKHHDAVLLATGVWKETSLPKPSEEKHPEGVVDALSFLESVKRKEVERVPDRVALLAGGDCAMDSARMLVQLGAKEIFVIFHGPRSEMHWHMPESWFASPGVHSMMSWTPLSYAQDADGQLTGVHLRHSQLGVESIVEVELVVEALGLQVCPSTRSALAELTFLENGLLPVDAHGATSVPGIFAAGGIVNGGASVGQCVAEGCRAASAIHDSLA